MHWAAKALIASGTVATAGMLYTTLIEHNRFTLRRFTVPTLPQGHSPVTVLHISDLHLMPGQSRKIAWVRRLAELQPDLVVNTGDNISSPQSLPALAAALSPLEGVPGIFVNGSNDFYAPGPINPLRYFSERRTVRESMSMPVEALWSLLKGLGWQNAEEQRIRFDLHGSVIEVRGCGDAHIGRDYYPKVAGPTSDIDLLVGVSHAPYQRVLNQMAADGCDLILAGHTHGGQMCLPNGRALTTNCDLPWQKAKGLSTWAHSTYAAYLHVCAGLGTSPYAPYRAFCPPEATLLTLVERLDADPTKRTRH